MRTQTQPSGIDEVDELGELVWHYTDGPGLMSIVSSNVLWATASEFLNDEQEVQLGYARILEELHERASDGDPLATRLAQRAREAQIGNGRPSPGQFFILSAAAHWDLLAMWRCYGGLGESYAIGLDAQVPLSVLTDGEVDVDRPLERHLLRRRTWTRVRYDPSEQRTLAAAVFEGLLDGPRELRQPSEDAALSESQMARISQGMDDMEQALVLIKHEGFHDEREVRFTVSLFDMAGLDGWPGVVRYRPTAYGMAPHLWLTGDGGTGALTRSEATSLPIRAVAISPSPNSDAAVTSLRAMLRSRGHDVPVLRSRIPFRG